MFRTMLRAGRRLGEAGQVGAEEVCWRVAAQQDACHHWLRQGAELRTVLNQRRDCHVRTAICF